eukprot:gb/GECH01000679.1/.p1 GENE.gb/GECH01000679.1/~~gb/GECH01000679.1/.p1  ORF type:complete len:1077 (+),score=170.19 gb/GECH01000679.1/:1-3231(+)
MKRNCFQNTSYTQGESEPPNKRYRYHLNNNENLKPITNIPSSRLNKNLINSYTRDEEFELESQYWKLVYSCCLNGDSLIAEVRLDDISEMKINIKIKFNDQGNIESTHCENCSHFLWCSHVASVLFFALHARDQAIVYNKAPSLRNHYINSNETVNHEFSCGQGFQNSSLEYSLNETPNSFPSNEYNSELPYQFTNVFQSTSVSEPTILKPSNMKSNQQNVNYQIIPSSAEAINLSWTSIRKEFGETSEEQTSIKLENKALEFARLKDYQNANQLCFFHFQYFTEKYRGIIPLPDLVFHRINSLVRNWVSILLRGFEEDPKLNEEITEYLPYICEYSSEFSARSLVEVLEDIIMDKWDLFPLSENGESQFFSENFHDCAKKQIVHKAEKLMENLDEPFKNRIQEVSNRKTLAQIETSYAIGLRFCHLKMWHRHHECLKISQLFQQLNLEMEALCLLDRFQDVYHILQYYQSDKFTKIGLWAVYDYINAISEIDFESRIKNQMDGDPSFESFRFQFFTLILWHLSMKKDLTAFENFKTITFSNETLLHLQVFEESEKVIPQQSNDTSFQESKFSPFRGVETKKYFKLSRIIDEIPNRPKHSLKALSLNQVWISMKDSSPQEVLNLLEPDRLTYTYRRMLLPGILLTLVEFVSLPSKILRSLVQDFKKHGFHSLAFRGLWILMNQSNDFRFSSEEKELHLFIYALQCPQPYANLTEIAEFAKCRNSLPFVAEQLNRLENYEAKKACIICIIRNVYGQIDPPSNLHPKSISLFQACIRRYPSLKFETFQILEKYIPIKIYKYCQANCQFRVESGISSSYERLYEGLIQANFAHWTWSIHQQFSFLSWICDRMHNVRIQAQIRDFQFRLKPGKDTFKEVLNHIDYILPHKKSSSYLETVDLSSISQLQEFSFYAMSKDKDKCLKLLDQIDSDKEKRHFLIFAQRLVKDNHVEQETVNEIFSEEFILSVFKEKDFECQGWIPVAFDFGLDFHMIEELVDLESYCNDFKAQKRVYSRIRQKLLKLAKKLEKEEPFFKEWFKDLVNRVIAKNRKRHKFVSMIEEEKTLQDLIEPNTKKIDHTS